MHDDPTLFRRWRDAKDEDAFAEIARRHADLVVDVARCVAGDRLTAEDALQRALLRLALETTDRPAAVGVRAWLAAAALGVARNARTAERRRAARERVSSERRTSVERSPTADDGLEAWLRGLDGEERALLRLRYAYGLDTDELAEVYGARSGTVRVRLHRALERLRAEAPPKRVRALLLASLGARGLGVSQAVVQAATRGALAAASGATASGTVGRVAIQAARSSVLRLWAPAGVAAALVGFGAWIFLRSAPVRPVATPTGRETASHATPDRPILLGRGAVVSHAPSPPAAPSAVGDASNPLAMPRPVRQSAARASVDPRLVRTRVRMRLGDGGEAIPLIKIWTAGEQIEPVPSDPVVALLPGEALEVWTDDPRAAFRCIRTFVPDPVPAEIMLRRPDATDPRLASVTLRVLDLESRAPLPEAYLDFGPAKPGEDGVLRADAEGRIRIAHPGEGATRLLVDALMERVFEPDHLSGDRSLPQGLGLTTSHIESWLVRGEVEVLLAPYPEGGGEAVDVRLVRPSGEPAAGLCVAGEFDSFLAEAVALRSDTAGRVRWKRAPHEFGFVVYENGAAEHMFVASRASTRRLGTRTLTLPALVAVDVEVVGLPPETRAARVFDAEVLDGLDRIDETQTDRFMLNGVRQPPAAKFVDGPLETAAGPVLGGDPTVIRFRLPEGRASTLRFTPPEGAARWTDVTPERDGTRTLRRWADLRMAR